MGKLQPFCLSPTLTPQPRAVILGVLVTAASLAKAPRFQTLWVQSPALGGLLLGLAEGR